MTLVAVIDYFDEMVGICDTRISYGRGIDNKQYGLGKINGIIHPSTGTPIFWAFAGPLVYGHAVMERVAKEMSTYSDKLTMVTLDRQFRGWIQSVIASYPIKEDENSRTNSPSFLLAGYEPTRRHKLTTGEPLPFPFYERYFYKYVVKNNKVLSLKTGRIAIIGSGAELKNEIEEHLFRLQNFGSGFPDDVGHWVRARMACEYITHEFASRSSDTVGGPYIIQRFSVGSPLKWDYAWSSSWAGFDQIDVSAVDDAPHLKNRRTSEERTILNILQWGHKFPADKFPNSSAMA